MAIRKELRDAKVRIPPTSTGAIRTKPKIDAPTSTGEPRSTTSNGAFVAAKDDVPVDTRIGTSGPVDGAFAPGALLVDEAAKRDTETSALTAEQRLRSLLGKTAAPPPDAAPPKAAVLERAVVAKLGEAATHMSALEVATALGAPSWADAIKDAGACDENASVRPNWLLAVHLTKWMESMAYAGATRVDVAKSFLAAHPDLEQRFGFLDARFVEVLQKTYPFMPQWSTSPAPHKADADWADTFDAPVADPMQARLDAALKEVSEVPLTMKLTGAVAETLADKQPFAGANVVMVQHMLGQANPLVDAMCKAGLDVTRAEYVGIPYQKNPAVRTTLEQGHGLKVTVPEVGNIDDMWKVITAAVDRAFERHLQNGEPILILDDGGYASKYIAEKYRDRADAFKVVEQTTRGLTEISKIENVPHSIVDVGGSYGKRFESAQVGDAVKMAVRRVLDAVTTTPARKDVLVVGAGKVGEGVADSFAGDGARITVFDPFITPARKKELEAKGFTVITDKEKALDKKFLVIGCSGHRSIDMADFAKMSSPVFLASASSKRVEIDTIGLGELATDKEGHLRKILAAKIGEQETWHYYLENGRIVTAMADGLPVNFQAVNSIAPELIDHTMALMLLGAAQAMSSTKPGLNALDPSQQFVLQAAMEDLSRAPTHADGELALTLGDDTFYGSRADWMRIATSPATPPAVLTALFDKLVGERPKPSEAMDPIALAILSNKHDLEDALVDKVLTLQIIPHASRLLQNESLTDAQEDRILDWLEKSFWAAAGGNRDVDDVRKVNAIAVDGDARTGFGYLYADVVTGGDGRMLLAHRSTTVVDAITRQTSDTLFAHPRAPEYLRKAFLRSTYSIAGDGLASTVLRVQSPAWTPKDLDMLFGECASAAFSRLGMSGKRETFEYAYDLLEAFRDHPSASEALSAAADEYLVELQKKAHEKGFTLAGKKGWTPSVLGVPLPDYA